MKARFPATIAVLSAALVALTAADASARMFSRSYNGWYGNRSATINRTAPGQVTGSRAFLGPNGGGYTRNFSRNCAGGTCSSSASTHTNAGQNWSHTGTATFNGNGSVSYNRNGVGPQGGTVSRSGSCTGGAGCSSTAQAMGPNGTNYTAQRSAQATGNGFVNHSATFTGPNGGTFSHNYTTGGLW